MTSVSYLRLIVVGAGAPAASWQPLGQRHGATVLLLEGAARDNMLIHMPAGAVKIVFGKSPYIKRYTSTPSPPLEGRAVDSCKGTSLAGELGHAMTTPRLQDDYDVGHVYPAMRAGAGRPVPYFRKQEATSGWRTSRTVENGPLSFRPGLHLRGRNIFVGRCKN